MVTPLTTKLLRDLWRLRAQGIAIALVIAAGVGMVVMSFGMIRSLEATRASYYDAYRFAELFAPVRRAPNSVIADVRLLPGVAFAEGRVTSAAILDVAGISEPVSARLHSLPTSGGLNKLVLRSGRMPDPGDPSEAVVNEAFAKAARIGLGDELTALIYGKQVPLRIVGTVLSPEYVYAVAPGQIFPDNRRYGIVWMDRETLAGSLDLRDSFNEAVVSLAPGAVRGGGHKETRPVARSLWGHRRVRPRLADIRPGSFPTKSTSSKRWLVFSRRSSSPVALFC